MPLQQRVVGDVADLFGVLAHPTRVKILSLLHEAEHDVSELRDRLQVTATNVSQHLAILRARSVVVGRREGNNVRYSIAEPAICELLDATRKIFERQVAANSRLLDG